MPRLPRAASTAEVGTFHAPVGLFLVKPPILLIGCSSTRPCLKLNWQRIVGPGTSFQNRSYCDSSALFWIPEDDHVFEKIDTVTTG
jgi:hypothetical protein